MGLTFSAADQAEKASAIVRLENFIEGIERPRRQKGDKAPQARPLIKFGHKFVLDRKWVAAQIAPIDATSEPIVKLEPENYDARKLCYHYGFNEKITASSTGSGQSELQNDAGSKNNRRRTSRRYWRPQQD